jgi:RNA polymerase sigma-70 factor (ECF subfamily)
VTTAPRSDEFERLRSHLVAVAYRLTGTFADAEDAVQDAWLRWEALGQGRDGIVDLRAWLTTVVSRIGLDRLRSAAHRRAGVSVRVSPSKLVAKPAFLITCRPS